MVMAIFPPSTNADYRGAKVSAWFLMLAGVLEFIPGCIHYFLPDGGAGVIGGVEGSLPYVERLAAMLVIS